MYFRSLKSNDSCRLRINGCTRCALALFLIEEGEVIVFDILDKAADHKLGIIIWSEDCCDSCITCNNHYALRCCLTIAPTIEGITLISYSYDSNFLVVAVRTFFRINAYITAFLLSARDIYVVVNLSFPLSNEAQSVSRHRSRNFDIPTEEVITLTADLRFCYLSLELSFCAVIAAQFTTVCIPADAVAVTFVLVLKYGASVCSNLQVLCIRSLEALVGIRLDSYPFCRYTIITYFICTILLPTTFKRLFQVTNRVLRIRICCELGNKCGIALDYDCTRRFGIAIIPTGEVIT